MQTWHNAMPLNNTITQHDNIGAQSYQFVHKIVATLIIADDIIKSNARSLKSIYFMIE